MPTMRAAGMARCWRRPRRWRSWRRATGRRTGQPIAYDETIRVGEVDVRFVPAGHVLGSAQIVLEHKGERVVVSGDYKRRPDPTCRLLRAGAVRHLHHRGDLRPAGVPPSRHRQRDRPAAPPPARRPEPLRAGRRLCAGQGAADHHRASRARPPRPDLFPRRDRAAVPALRGASAWRSASFATRDRRDQGGDGGPYRHRPAGRAQRPLVAAAARSGDGDGVGLDAHPPARPPAQRRAAADHLRPCRLGRADHDHPRARADAKCGSPTAARKRSSIGA